ncbi:MAG: 50S ribosomal protein L25 [Clostridia bacterium]|nr:50S ribosomal protein L25 [Clostridia bacterium]
MELKLSAKLREKKEKITAQELAAVLYGRDQETISLKLNYNEFEKLFAVAGESNLISLDFNGQAFPVLVKAVQKHVVKDTFLHIDFYKVNMKEKVKADVPLKFTGVSKAVNELGAVFITNIDELSVECLPSDLVDHIMIDISSLEEPGDVIRVEDVKLPEGLHLFHEAYEIICNAEEPKKVEEIEVVKEELSDEEAKKETEEGKEELDKENEKK